MQSKKKPAKKKADKRRRDPLPDDAPVIALVGRPNVGKSTIFNRLTRSRQALVTDIPGTTRDRREGEVRRGEYQFRLIDTGGMGFGGDLAFSAEVEGQIGEALEDASLVWVVLDGKEGLNPFDGDLVNKMIKAGLPFEVVVNKIDNDRREGSLSEFYRLGIDRMHPVSASHGLGITDLLEASAKRVPNLKRPELEPDLEPDLEPEPELGENAKDEDSSIVSEAPLRVAFLGRPNVGKSSLVNRVLNKSRMIVSDIAGTTREAVEIPFTLNGRDYVLVDTAGIRRKSRTKEYLEKIGVLQSLGALNRVDVAILVVDGSEDLAVQDARIASYVIEHRRAVVVALNKWDLVGEKTTVSQEMEADAKERLRFLDFAPVIRTSALEGSGIDQLFKEVDKAASQFQRRLQTADLNRLVQAAVARFPPPAQGTSPTRVYYGTQIAARPPFFRFFTNHPQQIGDSYTRFFENQLRHAFGFKGTPLRIEWTGREDSKQGSPKQTRRRKSKR